jgi:HAD superfamily hydrolase (TIGR01509 family)
MITTLIFDLDGLIADTEKLHRQAYQEVLAEHGIDLLDRQYEEHWIRDGKGIGDFVSEQGLSVDPAVIHARKAERYEALVRSGVQAMPGALHALATLQPHRTLALATSSYQDAAFAVIDTLDIKDYFSCVATKSNAERMKPFPDIFLWVASHLGVFPVQCLVLQDAEKGILAADAAGMRSVAVPNVHTQDNDFSKATLILSSLAELTIERIEQLDKKHPTIEWNTTS